MHVRLTRQMRMPVVAQVKQPTVEQMKAGVDEFSYICLNFFAPINEIAQQEWLHCYNQIIWKPYYKQELKKNTKACQREFARLIDAPVEFMDDKELYYAFADCCDDEIRPNIERLRSELLKFLDKKGVIEKKLWADLEVARLVAAEATTAFKEIADDVSKRAGLNIEHRFAPFNPAAALKCLARVRNEILMKQDVVVEANECEEAVKEYETLSQEYHNAEFIKRALAKAKEQQGSATAEQ